MPQWGTVPDLTDKMRIALVGGTVRVWLRAGPASGRPRDPGGTSRMDEQTPAQAGGDDQHGWAPDQTDTAEQGREGVRKAFRADEEGGEPGPDPVVSDEEREGVSGTDTTAASPLGVGESIGRRGEDIKEQEGGEEGRYDTGTKGESQRPTGTSTPDDFTGVRADDDTSTQSPSGGDG